MIALPASGTRRAGDPVAGRLVFEQSGCGVCHAFAAAGAHGGVGPDLDLRLEGDAAAAGQPPAEFVRERVLSGPGIMPSFAGRLTDQQLDDLVAFIVGNVGKPPPSPPPLARMCLSGSDLPGSKVTHQGYAPDPDYIATYAREFSGGRIGSSRLNGIDCEVKLKQGDAEAAQVLREIERDAADRAGLETQLRARVKGEFGGAARLISFRITRVRKIQAGDGGMQVTWTVRASNTRFGKGTVTVDGSLVSLRVGRAIGNLVFLGKPGSSIAPTDVARTATLFANRIRAGLAAAA
jgi:hypothetical protein